MPPDEGEAAFGAPCNRAAAFAVLPLALGTLGLALHIFLSFRGQLSLNKTKLHFFKSVKLILNRFCCGGKEAC